MLMYDKLAAYYDALVKDEEATKAWVDFVKRHGVGRRILEVACGSGEITLALAQQGYQIDAGDISAPMLKHAQAKRGSEQIHWRCFDMRDLHACKQYDSILCFCDSINYLTETQDWQTFFTQAYAHLNTNGTLLFDMHSQDRLSEFTQEYCEAGYLEDTAYEWTINREQDYIYHRFVFYDEAARPCMEQHIQRVMPVTWVNDCLKDIGFQIEIYTDFDKPGIQSGEKYFYVCHK